MYFHATLSSASLTISSLVTIALIIFLSSWACGAAAAVNSQQQHLAAPDQMAATEQHRQLVTTSSSNQSEEVLRQLLRLAAREQLEQQKQQQEQNEAEQLRADELKAMLAALSKQQPIEKKQKKFAKTSDLNEALKRKLYKLLDGLADDPATASNNEGPSFVVNEPTLRKRDNQQVFQLRPTTLKAENDNDESKLVFMIKRKPTLDSVDNALGDLYDSQQQPAANSRRPVSLKEHQRNILDDTLNIRRDSIFTTNNHLGFKGPPKFGSDEQL